MSRLILVRHAQASIHAADYDQLSPLGERQAVALAEHWLRLGVELDAVYSGPLRRQRHTAELVAGAYRESDRSWPSLQTLPHLAEHQGLAVVKHLRGAMAPHDEKVAAWVERLEDDPPNRLEIYLEMFRYLTRRWVREDLPIDDLPFESWKAFRARVEQGMETLALEHEGGRTVAAFASAGSIAAMVGRALELADERVLEMSWAARNITTTELLFSGGRWAVRSFNALPHLTDPSMITVV